MDDKEFLDKIKDILNIQNTVQTALITAVKALRECAKTNDVASKALMDITEVLNKTSWETPK